MSYNYAMNDAEQSVFEEYENALKQYHVLINALHGYNRSEWKDNPKFQGLTADGLSDENISFRGVQQNMTVDGLNMLKKCASELMLTTKQMMSAMGDHSKFNNEQRKLYFDLQQNLKLAKADLSAAESLDENNLPSYGKMHRDATDIIIDTEGKIEKTGSQMSERIPLRYVDNQGNLQKGYFTRDTNSGITLDSICDDCSSSCPNLKDVMEEIKANPQIFSKISTNRAFDLGTNLASENPAKDFPDLLKDFGVSEASLSKVTWDKTAINAMGMVYKRRGFRGINATNKGFGIENGRNLNQRNAAMSDIATMLGIGETVAQSESMTIMENGEPVYGTFMKNAVGYHGNEINPQNSNFCGLNIGMDYASLGKSCSNMMVIDYISGNGDRHKGNLFFKIEPDSNGRLQFTGVQGIDNDSSFGNVTPSIDKPFNKLFSLKAMKYISKETAESVLKLNKDSLSTVLSARGLQEDEINACWQRTKNLQNAIRDRKIKPVDSTKWTKNIFDAQANVEELSVNPFYLCREKSAEYNKAHQEYFNSTNKERLDFKANTVTTDENNAAEKSAFNFYNQDRRNCGQKPQNLETAKKSSRFKDFMSNVLDKLFFSKKRASLKEKEREKHIQKGIDGLHSRVEMQDGYAIAGQQKRISKMFKTLRQPNDKDMKTYAPMYNSLEDLSSFLDTLKKELKNPTKDDSYLSKLTNGKGQLTDLGENILADKFAVAEKASKDYIVSMPEKARRNDMARLAIAENLHDLCISAKDARQRKVEALNELMVSSFKQIAEWNARVTKADPTSGEFVLASAALKAKQNLSSYVGNLETPTKEQRKQVDKDLAILTIAERIDELKQKDPQEYTHELQSLRVKPEILSTMADKLLQDPTFAKLTSEISPPNAMAVKAEKYLYREAKNFGVLKEIKEAEPIKEAKKETKTVKKDNKTQVVMGGPH